MAQPYPRVAQPQYAPPLTTAPAQAPLFGASPDRSQVMAYLLQHDAMPQGPALSFGEAAVRGLNTGLQGWMAGQVSKAGEAKTTARNLKMAQLLAPDDPVKQQQLADALGAGLLTPDALAPQAADRLGFGAPEKPIAGDKPLIAKQPDGSYAPVYTPPPDTPTPSDTLAREKFAWEKSQAGNKAPDTKDVLDANGNVIIGGFNRDTGKFDIPMGRPAPPPTAADNGTLTEMQDPNFPTDPTKTIKVFAHPDGTFTRVGAAPLNSRQEPPSALGKLIAERNGLFAKNPNDPVIKTYDAAIARAATGEKGLAVSVDTEGNLTVTQGDVTAPAEDVARLKQVTKMFGAMADDMPAADQLNQSIGALSATLQSTDTGAVPGFLEAVRKTTGIALSPQADKLQAANALVDYLTPRMRVPGSGSTSDMEMASFKNSLPTLMGTPQGNALVAATLQKLAQRRLRIAQISQDYIVGAVKSQDALDQIRKLPDAFDTFKAWQQQQGVTTDAPPPASGLSPEEWNAMPPEDRALFMQPGGTGGQ